MTRNIGRFDQFLRIIVGRLSTSTAPMAAVRASSSDASGSAIVSLASFLARLRSQSEATFAAVRWSQGEVSASLRKLGSAFAAFAKTAWVRSSASCAPTMRVSMRRTRSWFAS